MAVFLSSSLHVHKDAHALRFLPMLLHFITDLYAAMHQRRRRRRPLAANMKVNDVEFEYFSSHMRQLFLPFIILKNILIAV